MAAVPEHVRAVVLNALSPGEVSEGIAYLCVTPFAAGQTLEVPRGPLSIDRDAYVAFVDAEPGANWGHPCRYLLIDATTGQVASHERRFPAFEQGDDRWRVVHRAARKESHDDHH